MKTRFIVIAVVLALILFGTPAVLTLAAGGYLSPEKTVYAVGAVQQTQYLDPYNNLILTGGALALSKNANLELEWDVSGEGISEDEVCSMILELKPDIVFESGTADYIRAPETAAALPDTKFLLFDGLSTADQVPDNVCLISYRSEESSFVAGYIAGMETLADTVGILIGEQNSETDRFYYGFKAGVEYAAKERGVQIALLSACTNSYTDTSLGEKLADEMYDSGADIIYAAAGLAGNGAITAAEKYGLMYNVIGADTDQSYLSLDSVLCSAVKHIDQDVCDLLTLFCSKDGDSKELPKEIVRGYAADSSGDFFSGNGVGIVCGHMLTGMPILEDIAVLEHAIGKGYILHLPYSEESYQKWCSTSPASMELLKKLYADDSSETGVES